jgi:hypothetical protein
MATDATVSIRYGSIFLNKKTREVTPEMLESISVVD